MNNTLVTLSCLVALAAALHAQTSTDPSRTASPADITGGAWSGTLTEITGMHREQYQVIGDEFVTILANLRILVEQDLQRLMDYADEVGTPWTSGRLPIWSGVRLIP